MIPKSHWRIDHIAHAVHSLSAALETYEKRFCLLAAHKETLPEFKVEVAFIDFNETALELIAPMPGNNSLERFLSTRGEGLHHLAFKVDSIERELEQLRSESVRLIDEAPRKGSRDTSVAFLHPSSCHGVLIELVE